MAVQRRIYVASSWRNAIQPSVVAALREAGHVVYDFRHPAAGTGGFQWSDIDPNWRQWTPEQYRGNLHHPVAQEGFSNDFRAMTWADTCVLVLPCGRSAHAEAGWMAGSGRAVYALIVEPQEPELMYRLFTGVAISLAELLGYLAE